MAGRIVIHAGQHKTGSTSIQHYIETHVAFFRGHGFEPVQDWTAQLDGRRDDALRYNAKFIANAVVRDSLATPMRLLGACAAPQLADREAGLDRINAALRTGKGETLLLSAEAFSFLRGRDEMQWVERLCHGFDWRAVMFLREPKAWLESWRIQVSHSRLIETEGAKPNEGIFDLSATSWLTDHAAIKDLWGSRCAFLDYGEAASRSGSVIPAFLEAIGLDPSMCPPWDGFFLNGSAPKIKQRKNE
jgi:hypothetical protein